MEVSLRRKEYGSGGWWRRGLGQSGETEEEGTGLPTDAEPDYSSGETWNQSPQALTDYLALLEAGRQSPGDFGTPSRMPSSADIAKAIQMFATVGIKALAPSPVTGACPPNLKLVGAACVPLNVTAGTAAAQTTAPLVAGIPNSTLFMIVGGFGLLLILSKSGGRR